MDHAAMVKSDLPPGASRRLSRLRAPRAVGPAGTTLVPGIVDDVLRSAGRPLDPASRAVMEASFGHDFSRVRVHTDTAAAESARALRARAYTVGRTIVFGEGWYAPGTVAGRSLLGHELAHVVQQGGIAVDRAIGIRPAGSAAEAEAERAGRSIERETLPVRARAGRGWIQRSPLSDSVRADVGPDPSLEKLLQRLSDADVQGSPGDGDVDAEIGRLLAGRADDAWVAGRIRSGRVGLTTGALGPKGAGRKPVARPIKAFFFRGVTDRRALVIAGVHGRERQGMAVAEMLVADLQKHQPQLTTIVVPSLFPDNAARGRFGTRESGDTETNRNFPTPDKDLAAAGAVDALGKKILPENLLLMELMERFKPERIISIHGTYNPSLAGVFYDRRVLRAQERDEAWATAATYVTDEMGGGVDEAKDPLGRARMRLYPTRLADMSRRAGETDRQLSLSAARYIDAATGTIQGREGRVSSKAAKGHPSVAGNVGTTGDLDRAYWAGGVSEGISLGRYAPARGMSVFTVEPPIDRNVDDYDPKNKATDPTASADKITAVERRIELQSYADAVRTVLLGNP